MKKHIKPKPSTSNLHLGPRQLFILVGVFLYSTVAIAPVAHARPALGDLGSLSPFRANEQKMEQLDQLFELKQETLEDKQEAVKDELTEAQQIVNEKERLANQIKSAKDEVEQLKARVAEKKRLEAERAAEEARLAALRSVTIRGYAGDAAGNAYAAGNCTWYVKSRRPDIGNFWGNANAWYGSAQAAGFKTGSMGKTGAIGVSFEGWAGHVVYVESWNGDGTVSISEMNYGGLYVMNYRTVPESSFVYIYEK